MNKPEQLVKIRLLIFFMVILAISGITAFAPETELQWLLQFKSMMPPVLYSGCNKYIMPLAKQTANILI